MKTSQALGILSVVALCATAQGAVTFTFEDPGDSLEMGLAFGFFAPRGAPGGDFGTIFYSMEQAVNLTIDGEYDNAGPDIPRATVPAILTIDMMFLNTGFDGIPGAPFLAIVEGSFTFTRESDGMEIVTGAFSDNGFGFMILDGTGGAVLGSDNPVVEQGVSSFSYTAGPALADYVGDGAQLVSPVSDFSFSLTDLTLFEVVRGGGGDFIIYGANASFTGTSGIVPNPGAIALAGIGTLALATRRRNREV